MKSHDYHVLLHQILPYCLRGLMDKNVATSIMRLCRIFRKLCTKTWDPREYDNLHKDMVETMCLLEMYFPPSFFDVMTHLLVHLVEEIDIAGPVATRWMYHVERYLGTLKQYVRSKYRPEGCMAEGYMMDEALGFITEYMHNFQAVRTRIWDADEDEATCGEVLERKGERRTFTHEGRDLAHKYVLENTNCMQKWLRKYEQLQESNSLQDGVPFASWIAETIDNHLATRSSTNVGADDGEHISTEVLSLAYPPSFQYFSFKQMKAYGNHFRVIDAEGDAYVTYDSGVASTFVEDFTEGTPTRCGVEYVGVLQEIIRLDYGALETPVILFKCLWVDADWSSRQPSMKFDSQGLLLANFNRMLPVTADPYVFPSQVEQVFYGDMEEDPGWKVVMRKEAQSRRTIDASMDMHDWENDQANLHSPVDFNRTPTIVDISSAECLNTIDQNLAERLSTPALDHYPSTSGSDEDENDNTSEEL
ncbi:hypothetical protein R1sor_025501 [Riccia sorocarpa]|uniref:DUF4218 domain-containing protein n=1 Tax=Riccia sorocarpa TaxID=122646 RepID=A0ABD3G8T1_9MARC